MNTWWIPADIPSAGALAVKHKPRDLQDLLSMLSIRIALLAREESEAGFREAAERLKEMGTLTEVPQTVEELEGAIWGDPRMGELVIMTLAPQGVENFRQVTEEEVDLPVTLLGWAEMVSVSRSELGLG